MTIQISSHGDQRSCVVKFWKQNFTWIRSWRIRYSSRWQAETRTLNNTLLAFVVPSFIVHAVRLPRDSHKAGDRYLQLISRCQLSRFDAHSSAISVTDLVFTSQLRVDLFSDLRPREPHADDDNVQDDANLAWRVCLKEHIPVEEGKSYYALHWWKPSSARFPLTRKAVV